VIHPSKDIVGTKGRELDGKRVVLCITGSVAASKCPEVARALMRHGAEVFAIMSPMAHKIIAPQLMEWATGNAVVTELTGKIEHVALVAGGGGADLVLVFPATANTISKIACGIDDTPVTSVVSVALGAGVPVMVAPAMHESMYRHPAVAENIEKLRRLGVEFVGPRIEEGKAKVAEVEEVLEAVILKIGGRHDYSGTRVLITAGPTIEYIDPIRVITNRSSGKMGVAVAEEALRRGAEVTLVYGPGTAVPPAGCRVVRVETTEEMREAVISELRSRKYDVVVAIAAAADWTPEERSERKIPTYIPSLTLKLKPAPKVIESVKKVDPKTFLVAFKAEYRVSVEELVDGARRKLREVDADLIVANDVGREGAGFGSDANEVFIVDREGAVIHVPLSPKREVARKLLDVVKEKLGKAAHS